MREKTRNAANKAAREMRKDGVPYFFVYIDTAFPDRLMVSTGENSEEFSEVLKNRK